MRTAALVGVFFLAGCYDPYYNYDPYYQQQPVPPGQAVAQAPPEPYAEEIPPPEADGMVWCDGYWGWSGASYAWIGGRWLWPPSPGVYWYPGGWVRGPRGYVRVGGRWHGPGWRHPYAFTHRSLVTYRAPMTIGYYRRYRPFGGGYHGGGFRGWHGGGHYHGGHVGGHGGFHGHGGGRRR